MIESGISFEVRTTVHSDLINETELRMMIDYLKKKHYNGNYYIQYFVNEVPTLEKLGYSSRELNNKNLSTAKIEVHFRG